LTVKLTVQNSWSQDGNVAELVGATSGEVFLVAFYRGSQCCSSNMLHYTVFVLIAARIVSYRE